MLRGILVGLLLVVGVWGCAVAGERAVGAGFSLKDLSGKVVEFDNFRGQVVLVNFWASWCPPCVHELPSMQGLKASMAGESFSILAVNMGERRGQIQNFVDFFGWPLEFTMLVDREMLVASDWGVQQLPTSFLVDKRGRVVKTVLGPRDWNDDASRGLVLALLDEPYE